MTPEAARDMLNAEARRIATRDGHAPRTYTLDEVALAVRTGRALLTIVRTSPGVGSKPEPPGNGAQNEQAPEP